MGLFMVLFGLGAFGLFAINLQTNGPLISYDLVVAEALHRVALASPAWVRSLMISGYYLGQHVIVAIGLLLALYFLYRRFWSELAMVVIAWAGEGALWMVLANHFDRSRPAFDVAVWHSMTAPGFPSGHAISAIMCYGLLAYLIAPQARSHRGKAAIIALALLVILLIGFSRLFIGDHYLTDVLAGLALGIAWSGLVYTGIERAAGVGMQRRRKRTSSSLRPEA